MKNAFLLLAISFFCAKTGFAQDPFIKDNEGLGRYGYINANAVTYARLSSSTYSNINRLRARWWADGEWIYYTAEQGCTGAGTEASTANFSHANLPNWDLGEIAYVSVQADYCNSIFVSTGMNERQFRKVDINNTEPYSGLLTTTVVDGQNNLFGTFVVNTGNVSLTLDRLWIENKGSAQEGSDLLNSIKIYYEDVTGAETFDGTESYALIYGDYNANPTNNNEFGSDDLNISITGGTKKRFYVVIDNFSNGYNTNTTVQFHIMNDGISFQEKLNTNYNLVRVNELNITGTNVVLPVELASFTARTTEAGVELEWVTLSEENNHGFEVQRAADGRNFETIDFVVGQGSSIDRKVYTFLDARPILGLSYYRLKQLDFDGKFSFSDMVSVTSAGRSVARIYPVPALETLTVRFPSQGRVTIRIFDLNGRPFYESTKNVMFGFCATGLGEDEVLNTLQIDVLDLTAGNYFLHVTDTETQQTIMSERFVKQ